MEAEEILAQAKADAKQWPESWIVLPLLRNKLLLAIVGWIFGTIFGLGLFALFAPFVIPRNYISGPGPAIVTSIVLGVVLFVGLGSAWTLAGDIRRLLQLREHILVITPHDFVKQEGKKIIHVPLQFVRYVTARGLPSLDRESVQSAIGEVPKVKENTFGFLLGRGVVPSGERWRRKRMRTPTTVAFVDSRTNQEIVILNDESYGNPLQIATVLKEYAEGAQQLVR